MPRLRILWSIFSLFWGVSKLNCYKTVLLKKIAQFFVDYFKIMVYILSK